MHLVRSLAADGHYSTSNLFVATCYLDSTNRGLSYDCIQERWTLARRSGIDIVVEYDLNLSGSSPHKFLRTCIRSQVIVYDSSI